MKILLIAVIMTFAQAAMILMPVVIELSKELAEHMQQQESLCGEVSVTCREKLKNFRG